MNKWTSLSLNGWWEVSVPPLHGPEEEEEGNPGEVTDGNFSWGGSLDGGIQGLDGVNREWPHSYWGRIFFLIVHHLASQPKVKFSHAFMEGVVGTQGCEYLSIERRYCSTD